jgi:hypothetical protein
MSYFNNEEILKILYASRNNTQISWIINKPQIKELIGQLYESQKEIIEDKELLSFLSSKFE